MSDNKNNNPKNVDGVKKMSEEEVRKSRQIVLDAIGETEEGDLSDLEGPGDEAGQEKDKEPTKEEPGQGRGKPEKKTKEKGRLQKAGKDKAGSGSFRQDKGLAPNMLKGVSDKEPKAQTPAKQSKNTQQGPQKGAGRQQQVKQSGQPAPGNTGHKQTVSQKRTKRLQKLQQVFFRSKNNKDSAKPMVSLKKVFYILVLLILAGLTLYSLAVLAVTQIRPSSGPAYKMSQYLPIPALLAEDGIMEYHDYIDMRSSFLASGHSPEQAQKLVQTNFAKQMAVNRLLNDYELLEGDDDFTTKELRRVVVSDQSINLVANSRIKKIKEMVKEQNDFVMIANTYGDEQGQLTLSASTTDQVVGGEQLLDLEKGQVSDVIVGQEGYYMYRCFGRQDESLDLGYVFVEAKTLEDYIEEYIKGCVVWSLVE